MKIKYEEKDRPWFSIISSWIDRGKVEDRKRKRKKRIRYKKTNIKEILVLFRER